jgi:hypothetical protein
MLLRRAVYLAQFPLAVVLPLWVLVTRGIIADGIGVDFLVYLFACPVLFVALATISGLISARKQVRVSRAVSWLDAGMLAALWIAIAAYGLFAETGLAAVVVILLALTGWVVTWELVEETRSRIRGFAAGLEAGPRRPGDAGRIVVVPPERFDR